MAEVGLTKEQLEDRNKDSLIKYIGVLQGELQLIYSSENPEPIEGANDTLDLSASHKLKLTHGQAEDIC